MPQAEKEEGFLLEVYSMKADALTCTLHGRAASLVLSLEYTYEFTIINKTARNASFQFEKLRSHLRPIY
jgi:hypothetical protein